MPGYSGTPLSKKLGIKPGMQVCVLRCPLDYRELVDPLPEGVTLARRVRRDMEMVHLFVTLKQELAAQLEILRERIQPAGVIWVSWPKKAARVETDVTEDVIREVCLPLGLVDVKVCAVDDVWSGLKLVIRKELRRES